jgi:hypothetical protein
MLILDNRASFKNINRASSVNSYLSSYKIESINCHVFMIIIENFEIHCYIKHTMIDSRTYTKLYTVI